MCERRRVMAARERIALVYRRFAEVEAAGRSPVYADLARRVSHDDRALAFLSALPPAKWQPNLFLAAMQFRRGRPLRGWEDVTAELADHADDVRRIMLARTTQTNIPARCATLLPVLASLPEPLALVEVGASAGLCLFPDRHAYDYDGHRIGSPDAPVLRCTADSATPLPSRPVEVAWRAGLDLNPLKVADPADRAWLEALVWSGEEHLRDQLLAACEIARREPPLLVAGDLVADLPPLLAKAPAGATLVVFHSAVLSYVSDDDRRRFVDVVTASSAIWLANEAPAFIPGLDRAVVDAHPAGLFLLCRDGCPVALTDPHGGALHWVADHR
jgi:hypothetical protein